MGFSLSPTHAQNIKLSAKVKFFFTFLYQGIETVAPQAFPIAPSIAGGLALERLPHAQTGLA
jgi:hypothetical protein